MSVYRKLSDARIKLQQVKIKKSGRNTFANYNYMQLEDFLPPIQEIFHELNLIGVVSFSEVEATLTIVDVENPLDRIVIHSPMSEAALKGCHAVQNLGAVQTYLRRYLWVAALEIVEHDALDSSEPIVPEEPVTKVAPKPEPKKEPVKIEGQDSPWQMKIEVKEGGNWVDGVKWAADTALTFALKPEDVTNIFKVNRNIFDKLKIEDPAVYEELMVKFKEYKTNLIKE